MLWGPRVGATVHPGLVRKSAHPVSLSRQPRTAGLPN
jgi:hypothetical protein